MYVTECRHLLNDGITRAIVEHHHWAVERFLSQFPLHGITLQPVEFTTDAEHCVQELVLRIAWRSFFLLALDDANVISKPDALVNVEMGTHLCRYVPERSGNIARQEKCRKSP